MLHGGCVLNLYRENASGVFEQSQGHAFHVA